jgi:hypothetical protein
MADPHRIVVLPETDTSNSKFSSLSKILDKNLPKSIQNFTLKYGERPKVYPLISIAEGAILQPPQFITVYNFSFDMKKAPEGA